MSQNTAAKWRPAARPMLAREYSIISLMRISDLPIQGETRISGFVAPVLPGLPWRVFA
jgi:hypothetical protein